MDGPKIDDIIDVLTWLWEENIFECVLDERQHREMKAMVRKIIQSTQDLVRNYTLCEDCRNKIQAINGSVTTVERTIVI